MKDTGHQGSGAASAKADTASVWGGRGNFKVTPESPRPWFNAGQDRYLGTMRTTRSTMQLKAASVFCHSWIKFSESVTGEVSRGRHDGHGHYGV